MYDIIYFNVINFIKIFNIEFFLNTLLYTINLKKKNITFFIQNKKKTKII